MFAKGWPPLERSAGRCSSQPPKSDPEAARASMTNIQELVATDPILGATRAQLESLQLERLRATLRHAYANNASYRQKFSAAGVHPDDLRSLGDLARFP